MAFTDINVDGIEKSLPGAMANKRNKLIQNTLKNINTWLSSDPTATQLVEVIYYKEPNVKEKFPVDPAKQLLLLEHLFDKNQYIVYVSKTFQTTTKTLFGTYKVNTVVKEEPQYLGTFSKNDMEREVEVIKEILMALKNPRVILTVEEHKNLAYLLSRFSINLSDYYI